MIEGLGQGAVRRLARERLGVVAVFVVIADFGSGVRRGVGVDNFVSGLVRVSNRSLSGLGPTRVVQVFEVPPWSGREPGFVDRARLRLPASP